MCGSGGMLWLYEGWGTCSLALGNLGSSSGKTGNLGQNGVSAAN